MDDINEKYNSFLNDLENNLTAEEERASQNIYEQWKQRNKSSEDAINAFISRRKDNITEIMHRSDELISRNGKVSRIEKTTIINESEENKKLKKEIEGLKDDIKEMKQLLISKLS